MRHRKGIALLPPEHDEYQHTFASLPQWYEFRAACPACGRTAHVDRYAAARRFGGDMKVGALARKLVCRGCGNDVGNALLIGMMSRD